MQVLSFVFLIFIAAVSPIATNETRHTSNGPGHGTPTKGHSAEAIKAKTFAAAKDFLTSIVSRVDDRILVNLGDHLDRIFGENGQIPIQQQLQSSTPEPPTAQPRLQIPIPHSGELIRLRAENGFMNAGIVEVYRTGRWGLVCDDAWDVKDANVACRQLGFKQGAKGAPGEAHYGVPTGRWRSEDILMDDVECEGSETSLQRCMYKDRHDCTPSEAASVICTPNFGCPDGWIGYGESCYRFYGGARNFKAASNKCRSLNASLVSIESAQENHFLSNVISLTVDSDEHMWFTSGRLSKNAWRWYRTVPRRAKGRKSARRGRGKKGKSGRKGKGKASKKGKGKKHGKSPRARSTSTRMRTKYASFGVSKWFPGWNLHNGLASAAAEPTVKKGHTCLVLTDLYPLPNGTEVSVDYYYWRTSRCRLKGKTLSFICEMPALPAPKECYTGIGEDYRGLMSHTDRGTACLPWTSTVVTNESHPGKGIGDHNYCRNPDGDKRPWCWVARGKFGFCPIPLCSSTTTAPSTTTTVSPDTLNCPSDEFYCSSNQQCIPGIFVCDGEVDCDSGEDENECDYMSEKFEEYANRIPHIPIGNLSYVNSPLETCAKSCLENTYFTCVSFVYNEDERTCQLLNQRDDHQTRLKPDPDHDYYLLTTEAENCTGKFRCKNERCIPSGDVCNGHDDCGDLSDELDCTTSLPPMTVRLAEGSEENEGRVEVHYAGEWGTVCDDEWDIYDAIVVCRMLGYPGARRAAMMGEFGAGRGNIMLDELSCLGTEENIQDCPSSPLKQHDCQPFEAAGVVCETNKTCKDSEFACRGEDSSIDHCLEASEVCDGNPSCDDASDEKQCDLQVELVDGKTPHEGRVELIRNGVRGTICDDDWGPEEATVVCRMLGYTYGGRALLEAHFGQGTSGVIWLDELKCSGAEKSLEACVHNGWTINDCSSLEDAGVRCFASDDTTNDTTDTTNDTTTAANVSTNAATTDSSVHATTTSPQEVLVFLVDGSGPNEGRVEIQVGGTRGTICDDSFDEKAAAVICRMAGFNDGGQVVPDAGFGKGSAPILLDDVQCHGNETLVTDCDSLPLGSHNCQQSESVGVICTVSSGAKTTTVPPATTRRPPTNSSVLVFLEDGSGPNEGRVEIQVGGKRGTICDDSFDEKDAAVICRMAGFDQGGKVVPSAFFGEGRAPILLDEVECHGNETLVTNCGSLPLGSHDCEQSEAVGVICFVSSGVRLTTVSPATTRGSPTDVSDNVQCGLRPLEGKIRRRRQSPSLTALRVTEKPRYQKIVGGDLAPHGMYPWQVGVNKIYNIYASGEMLVSHWCGATIITSQWVLSAAHCFKNLAKSRVLLIVGNHGQKAKDIGEQKFLVEELVMHRNYDNENHDYDIAMLKVKSDDGQGIKFNDYVQPACLPDKNTQYVAGTSCHISGWGEKGQSDGSSTDYPNHLRAAEVPLLPFRTCNYLYKGDLSSRMLCAGYLEGGIDTCQGDSGGPLVCKVNDVYTLMGVTSWGFGCAKPNSPGVYARTQSFLDWIEYIMVKYS